MTVIVWDGKTLAADSHANNGDISFPVVKLYKGFDDKGYQTLYGFFGNLKDVQNMLEWASSGAKAMEFPLIEVDSGTVIVNYTHGVIRIQGSYRPILHGKNKCAFGSGAPIAYGALYTGAIATLAVEAAIAHSVHCNGQPVYMEFD